MEQDSQSYIIFTVQNIKLALGVLTVREIISPEYMEPRRGIPVPFLGEVNLRNTLIPVIGMHAVLGVFPPVITAKSRILIMEKELNWYGIMIDSVLEMTKSDLTSLFPLPEKFTDLDPACVLGIGVVHNELVYFLNPANIINMGQLNQYYRMMVKPKESKVFR